MPEQRITFQYLDQDTEQRLMQPGAARYMLNCRVGSTLHGNKGAIETVRGNQVVSFMLPEGENTVIGSVEDREEQATIYFICNSLGEDRIIRYSTRTSSVEILFRWDKLNFSAEHRITGAAVIGRLLFWTDGRNQLRKLNIDRALAGGYEAIKESEPNFLNALVAPPALPLSVGRYSEEDSTKPNLIKNEAFQFTYRYQYADGEYSVLAPCSALSPMSISKILIDAAYTPPENKIRVSIPNGEKISALVERVELLFRSGNTGNWAIFETAYRQGGAFAREFFFDNSRTGYVLDAATAAKPFESIPLTATALTAVDNRLMVANYEEGYEKPHASLSVALGDEAGLEKFANWGDRVFKSGSTYKVGVLYKDYAGRNAGVASGAQQITTPLSVAGQEPVKSLRWVLTGEASEIPEWATHYHVVLTKNQNVTSFLSGRAPDAAYCKPNAEKEVGLEFAYLFEESFHHIAIDISDLTDVGLGYTFAPGDMVRLRVDRDYQVPGSSSTSTRSELHELEVKGQFGRFVLVALADVGDLSNAKQGDVRYELYTPNRVAEQDIFFEVGACYPINDPGQPMRSYTVTTGKLQGDCTVVVRRWYQYALTTGTVPYDIHKGSNEKRRTSTITNQCEAMSPNDNYAYSWDTDAGRASIEQQNARRELRKNYIRFSNPYLHGTRLNGLCEFEALNEYQLPVEHGAITKLQPVEKLLLALQQYAATSIYVGQSEITDTQGQTLISVSDRVLGSNRPLAGGYGCQHPETVQAYNGYVYWFDANKGSVLRYAGNGMTDIGAYFMSSYFNRKAAEHRASPLPMRAGFDQVNEEYLLSIGEETVAFHESGYEEDKRWVSFYSFVPEWYANCGSRLLSFDKGMLYVHESDALPRNNFHGRQYPSVVEAVMNEQPDQVKVLQRLRLEGLAPWAIPVITNPDGQESELKEVDFEEYERQFYAEFLRDKRTPYCVLPLFEGDELRSSSFTLRLEYTGLGSGKLLAANIGYFFSNMN